MICPRHVHKNTHTPHTHTRARTHPLNTHTPLDAFCTTTGRECQLTLWRLSLIGLTVDAKDLWLNESLGAVKTPLMLVQAIPKATLALSCSEQSSSLSNDVLACKSDARHRLRLPRGSTTSSACSTAGASSTAACSAPHTKAPFERSTPVLSTQTSALRSSLRTTPCRCRRLTRCRQPLPMLSHLQQSLRA